MSGATPKRRPASSTIEGEPRGLAPRRGAVALLAAVLDRGRMLDEADAPRLTAGPERAEARALADTALRRLGQIDAVLAEFVPRPPPGRLPHVLRLMAAEVLFAGRAVHAAVDMGVRLAKEEQRGRFAALANAVGRRLVAEGHARVAEQDAPWFATPPWLWRRLSADWGAETTRAIAEAHLTPAPHDLTPRAPAEAETLAHALDATLLPSGTLRLDGRPQLSALTGYAEGHWWAQDAAAALPVQLLGEIRGRRVLDLCAAPGGKTLQLAAAGADVTALDVSERRLARLRENLQRTGLTARIVTADALDWRPEAAFDAVLLDAPCSATGTIRRHPDLPHRLVETALADLVALQGRLLARAAEWVAPGGRLVYCTCSLLSAEGEDRARTGAGDLSAEPLAADGPLAPFVTPEGWLRTRPDMAAGAGGLDGFFAARFRRT